MHDIEPYYNWRDYYIASEDKYSPFYGREYNEFEFSQTIYNYYIHPQWDEIGSPTLFIKLLFVDYASQFAVIELFGEWNDCINNDIMFLKRNIIEKLEENDINKFLLIGENVLNFHASEDDYYAEWYEEVADEGGWVVAMNFRQHVIDEMKKSHLHYYLLTGDRYNDINWRTYEPLDLLQLIDNKIIKALP